MKTKMSTITKPEQMQPVIETSTIRLTADETKALIKAHLAGGRPVSYGYGGTAVSLMDMGLLQIAKPIGKTQSERVNDLWAEVVLGASHRSRSRVDAAFRKFDEGKSADETKAYVLTDSGKQIARGITIKLNAQYAGR